MSEDVQALIGRLREPGVWRTPSVLEAADALATLTAKLETAEREGAWHLRRAEAAEKLAGPLAVERDTLTATVARLTAERDDARSEIEAERARFVADMVVLLESRAARCPKCSAEEQREAQMHAMYQERGGVCQCLPCCDARPGLASREPQQKEPRS